MSPIHTLASYKAWADKVFLSVVADIPESELLAPRKIGFGNILRTLNHSYSMDFVWKCHLLGVPHGLATRNPLEAPSIAELIFKQYEIDQWYVDYSQTLNHAQLDETVEFTFIGGGEGSMSRADIIMHVVNHTTYHRGHVADILYNLDVFPPTTDLPVFIRNRQA